ncbi:peptide/nickel transport system ATP-binding protein [Antricoccus suffuscus]|uniref:Peptide/nickel transport system ATP-binding protein n=1 Tax=Antricoccus suffuscus TaxID=1629062 RepID=A0A2T0ZW54_9ACTN|nr:ATP-binding cassette domain-containing protein [Antricoccus suffuscus]PRZ40487.1 peptide/nickel transport system ATP-binding protein [Antricoccus suffuscus]
MSASSSTVLDIRNLTVTYPNGFQAVRGIDLQVEDGESVAIVGESGCGKTTCIRAVLGLLGPRTTITGVLGLQGTDLNGMTAKTRRPYLGPQIGYVAQDPYSACDPLRTVGHHVAEPWRMHGIDLPRGEVARRLEHVGIPDADRRSRQYPHQWSGGMLQRATIVASTALDPILTLADEPTSALDADLADGVMHVLRERSRSLLFVTHDLALAAAHADRIVVIDRGTIIETGPSAAVVAAPAHERTRSLLEASKYGGHHLRGESLRTDHPVVRGEGLMKSYRTHGSEHRAVDRISIDIAEGEIVGIAGPSGSGKSTLLRLIAGTERPDAGQIRYGAAGEDSPRPGTIMPIFQDPVGSLDQRWPLWRSITEPLTADRRSRPRRAERKSLAREALDDVGLSAIPVTAHPSQLSVGQCQRVAIARAVVASPALVVADEPTASLDATTATEIINVLSQVSARGTAIVLVSHDLRLLEAIAGRVLTVHDGRLVEPDRAGRTP